jgi:hypothetical protein
MRLTSIILFILVSIAATIFTLKYLEEKSELEQIYAFTHQYDSQKNIQYPLTNIQQKTVNQIIEAYDLFLTEKSEEDFPVINDFSQKNNWTVSFLKDYREQHKYYAKINDGSNVSILFQNYKDLDLHRMVVWNLNENQCNSFMKHYTPHQKINVETVAYTFSDDNGKVMPVSVEVRPASCAELNDPSKNGIAIMLSHNGKISGKSYPSNSKELTSQFNMLLNEDYKNFTTSYTSKLYFTDKSLTYIDFYNGIDYAVNPKNKHIFTGALTKEECKRLIYNLPNNVQYKVNGENQCADNLNTIEFFKQG